jgi:hypothetical protein
MRLIECLAAALVATTAAAQPASPPATQGAPAPARPASPAPAQPASPAEPKAQNAALQSLAWLEGCWQGTAGRREFREQWMPLRGQMMLGVSQTLDEKGVTQDYEYLRLEVRDGAVHYVAAPSGKAEIALKFVGETAYTANDRNDTVFTFVNPAQEFPRLISYRRATEGWLYASVEGKVAGAERKATYPMRRINCETGEVVRR